MSDTPRPDTVAALPALLRAARERLAQDCPVNAATAGMRIAVLYALDSAEVLASTLAALVPAVILAEDDVLEIPRVPRFGAADAAGPDRGLAPRRPHP